MMTCSECGGRMQQEVIETYRDAHIGIPVVLKNAAIRRFCTDCDNDMIAVPNMDELVAAAAIARCLMPVTLCSHEFRFLRKALGMTGREFAELTDNRPETVSRWENDAQGTGGVTEKLVRQTVCERLKTLAPAIDYEHGVIVNMKLVHRSSASSELPPLVFELVLIKFKGYETPRKARHWDTEYIERVA